jgi:hypothetical protein
MTEYADIENPTVVSVTLEEFLADLDEAGFQKAVVLSDKRTSPEQVSAFVSRAPDRLIGFGYVNPTEPGSGGEVLKQREELGLFGRARACVAVCLVAPCPYSPTCGGVWLFT